jgi:hypothetical protein
MTHDSRQQRTVVVAGDIAIDWLLAGQGSARAASAPSPDDPAFLCSQPGGAARVADVVSGMTRRWQDSGLLDVRLVSGRVASAVRPGDPSYHHAYAVCDRWPGRGDAPLRVRSVVGLTKAARSPATGLSGAALPGRIDLLVVEDANLGARDDAAVVAAAETADRVLVAMSAPVAAGELWSRLVVAPERAVVVTSIDDLRSSDVEVSREISWERTAQDLVAELLNNPSINELSTCAHLVVSFNAAGALVLSRGASGPEATLVFDPLAVEDSWERDNPGTMLGAGACLVAGVARALLLSPDSPDVVAGVRRGLAAMRAAHLGGYETRLVHGVRRLEFPVDRAVDALEEEPGTFAAAAVPLLASAREKDSWTFLADVYSGALDTLAQRIVVEGPERTLRGVPLGRFGKLLTVDRREIEGYGSIRRLIREYAGRPHPDKPLSIAVFGPPGAGKSFGVTQVARTLLPDRIRVLTFNCSQFSGSHDLVAALHQVRDAGLEGSLPLVFWDEFDAGLDGRPLGWLRHFLAPMQDGAFQDGQLVHPIGPAVFVFAGGTSEQLARFAGQTGEEFRLAKGPDFVSRLKGYVDVLGPNPVGGDLDADPYTLIRRAILLRSILQRAAPGIFHTSDGCERLDIDPGVLRGFLLVSRFRHGARSIESIVTTSLLGGRSRFERSCLPSDAQLELHVDAHEFRDLVHRFELGRELSDRLAEAAHVLWAARMLAQGFAWGEASDDYLRGHAELRSFAGRERTGPAHPNLVAYAALPETMREDNRAVVRDIPNKLASAGYVMRRARGAVHGWSLGDDDIDRLAEAEHERWLRRKLDAGWRYAETRDDDKRLHPCLVPWTKLSDDDRVQRYGALADMVGDAELPTGEKDKDRDVVRAIPDILAMAGYTIERLREDRA